LLGGPLLGFGDRPLEPIRAFNQPMRLLQLQLATLCVLQSALPKLQLLSRPLLASTSAAGDIKDRPITNDDTNTKRLIMTSTSTRAGLQCFTVVESIVRPCKAKIIGTVWIWL
jgi:hypothetical protein